MSALEAAVWIIGIITAGVTIRYTVGSFGRANVTIKEVQQEVKKNDCESDSEER